MNKISRIAALLLAATMAVFACSCKKDGAETASSDIVESSNEVVTSQAPVSSEPEISYPKDDPNGLEVYIPKPSEIPFSTETIIPGDPNFKPGSLYKGPTINFRKKDDAASFGMWVWNNAFITGKDKEQGFDCDMFLDMAIQNNINEIYIGNTNVMSLETQVEQGGELDEGYMSEMQFRGFVKKCNKFGIKVELLVGASGPGTMDWMTPKEDKKNEYRGTKHVISWLASYNSRSAADEKIPAIHLDIEPAWDGGAGRPQNVQWMAEYFTKIRAICDIYNIELAFDINAWTNEGDMVVNEKGERVNLLDVITKKCHSLAIMAYRPRATDQYDISSLEIEYAAKNNCHIVVGSETMDPKDLVASERGITYFNKGAKFMSNQQEELKKMLADSGCKKYGGAIHHAGSFFAMINNGK